MGMGYLSTKLLPGFYQAFTKRFDLAAVIDPHSRQVVGWSMKPHMQTSLVTDASQRFAC
ncbi:MAG: hypothetical protein ACREXV_01785 [Polaromonas sp.]